MNGVEADMARDRKGSVRVATAGHAWPGTATFGAAGAILMIALVARLFKLDGQPMWLDEVFTARRSALALPGLIDNSLRHHHSPLFFLLEHGMTMILPGTFGLRLIPAIAGAVSAPLVFAIGRAAGLRNGAVLAGLLAALAPLQVGFAQEARSYTLVTALILVSLWGLVRLAAEPARAALPWRDRDALRGGWAAYGLGLAGALLVHGDALPWLIASNVAMLFGILPPLEARRGFLGRWLLVQGLALVVTVPVYAAIVSAEHGQVVASFLWIPPLSWHFVWEDAASLYGLRGATAVTMRLIPTPVPAIALVAMVAGGIGFMVLRRRPGPRRVLLIGALGLPLVLTAISLIHPILLPRYLVWGPMPFFVLIGASIEALPRRGAFMALAAAALLLAVNLSSYYRSETKPRWDLAARFLAQRLQPQDVVLVADGAAPVMLRTYLGEPPDSDAFLHATRHFRRAAKAFAAGGHVYAVYGPAGQGRLPGRSAFFRSAEALGVAGKRHAIGNEITIERIGPPGSGVVACGAAGDVNGTEVTCSQSVAK